MIRERFAPSPTGLLHLGHAWSAWTAWHAATVTPTAAFLLRIEDLDTSRVRSEYTDAIQRDLAWLGLDWETPLLFQSERGAAYRDSLAKLWEIGVVYRCACTRRDILAAISAPQEGAPGPDGPVYPGTCRGANVEPGQPHALRLDMVRALEQLAGARLAFTELGEGPEGHTGQIAIAPADLIKNVGDVVLARRDGAIAYHLAVVVDDAHQQITHVTRGQDLFTATPIHVVLQTLLDLPTPAFRHHALVRDETGKRLAKRDDARSIAAYRDAGLSPADVLALARAGTHDTSPD